MGTKYFFIALALTLVPAFTFAQTAIVNGITWDYTLDAINNATIRGASPRIVRACYDTMDSERGDGRGH